MKWVNNIKLVVCVFFSLLIGCILCAPFFIGLLFEKNLEQKLALIEQVEGVTIHDYKYERSWFRSELQLEYTITHQNVTKHYDTPIKLSTTLAIQHGIIVKQGEDFKIALFAATGDIVPMGALADHIKAELELNRLGRIELSQGLYQGLTVSMLSEPIELVNFDQAGRDIQLLIDPINLIALLDDTLDLINGKLLWPGMTVYKPFDQSGFSVHPVSLDFNQSPQYEKKVFDVAYHWGGLTFNEQNRQTDFPAGSIGSSEYRGILTQALDYAKGDFNWKGAQLVLGDTLFKTKGAVVTIEHMHFDKAVWLGSNTIDLKATSYIQPQGYSIAFENMMIKEDILLKEDDHTKVNMNLNWDANALSVNDQLFPSATLDFRISDFSLNAMKWLNKIIDQSAGETPYDAEAVDETLQAIFAVPFEVTLATKLAESDGKAITLSAEMVAPIIDMPALPTLNDEFTKGVKAKAVSELPFSILQGYASLFEPYVEQGYFTKSDESFKFSLIIENGKFVLNDVEM